MPPIRYCNAKFGVNHFDLITKPTRNLFRNFFQLNDKQLSIKNKFLINQTRNSLFFHDQQYNFLYITKLTSNNNSFGDFKKYDGQNRKDDNEARQKCYFDMANIGLLETFGVIVTI